MEVAFQLGRTVSLARLSDHRHSFDSPCYVAVGLLRWHAGREPGPSLLTPTCHKANGFQSACGAIVGPMRDTTAKMHHTFGGGAHGPEDDNTRKRREERGKGVSQRRRNEEHIEKQRPRRWGKDYNEIERRGLS